LRRLPLTTWSTRQAVVPARSQPLGGPPAGPQPINLQPAGPQPNGVPPAGPEPIGVKPAGQSTVSLQEAGVPMIPSGVALDMTECDVVKRAGLADKVEIGANSHGERSATLTYLHGARPGIYHFAAGRLKAMDRAPEPPPQPKPVKKKKRHPRSKRTATR
jgi:hypothetical protein